MRTYADADGNTWMVYVVTPRDGTSPLLLPPEYAYGWLCFESDDRKRRLVPIPSDWESCTEARLDVYRTAAAVTPPRKLPTSDGRNAPERGGIADDLREIEHFFTRRLPASLSLALDRLANRLDQPDAAAVLKPAIPELRLAARAASSAEFDNAREHYRAAAAIFPAAIVDLTHAKLGEHGPARPNVP